MMNRRQFGKLCGMGVTGLVLNPGKLREESRTRVRLPKCRFRAKC